MLTEIKLGPFDWPRIIGAARNVMTEAPIERLSKNASKVIKTALQVMKLIMPLRTVAYLYAKTLGKVRMLTLEPARAEKFMNANNLLVVFENIQKDLQ